MYMHSNCLCMQVGVMKSCTIKEHFNSPPLHGNYWQLPYITSNCKTKNMSDGLQEKRKKHPIWIIQHIQVRLIVSQKWMTKDLSLRLTQNDVAQKLLDVTWSSMIVNTAQSIVIREVNGYQWWGKGLINSNWHVNIMDVFTVKKLATKVQEENFVQHYCVRLKVLALHEGLNPHLKFM